MIKILFICHGNICRSPMAEYLLSYMAKEQGVSDKFYIRSAAVSSEELGNPVHSGTKRVLSRFGIDCSTKRARKITRADYDEFDLLIAMDKDNLRRMNAFFGGDPHEKMRLMLDYTDRGGDVADPWYTGNFEQTLTDIKAGCEGILKQYA